MISRDESFLPVQPGDEIPDVVPCEVAEEEDLILGTNRVIPLMDYAPVHSPNGTVRALGKPDDILMVEVRV